MKKSALLALALLAAAPTAAGADDLGALCSYASHASHDDQLAIEAIRSQLWTEMSCELPSENDYPDRFDSSVLVHVGRMIRRFGSDAAPGTIERYASSANSVAYSMSKLDRARFDRELAKAPAGAKKLLGKAFELAQQQATQVQAWRARQSKGSAKAVWQTAWDAAVASVDKDWKTYGADLAFAMGALAKAAHGETCGDVRGRVAALIKTAAPKTRDDLLTLVHRPDVSMLVGASARCAAAAGDDKLGAAIGNFADALDMPHHYAGPAARVATLIFGRYQEAQDRKAAAGVTPPDKGWDYMVSLTETPSLDGFWGTRSDGKGGGLVEAAVYGEVAAKKPAKARGFVTLSFKKVVVTDRPLECTEGKRVVRVDEEGRLEYERSCSWGKPYKVDVSALPVDVPAAYAETIKPGNYVFVAELENGQSKSDTRIGVPVEQYKDSSKKDLIGFFGVALP